MSGPNSVLVALGANLGARVDTIRHAMDRLAAFAAGPVRRSSLWLAAPVDCPPGSPAFVNAAVALEPRSGETPESLLDGLKALEIEFGRQPGTGRNEPRPLDLDLIAFGQETRVTARLKLPHPEAHRRRFVLQPLAEVAPDFVLPGQNRTVAELLADQPVTPEVVWCAAAGSVGDIGVGPAQAGTAIRTEN